MANNILNNWPQINRVFDYFRAVQPQKMAGGLKFLDLEIEGLYFPGSENKGADQLHLYSTANLRLCFRLSKKHVFLSQIRDNFQYFFVMGMKQPTSAYVHRVRSRIYGKRFKFTKGGSFC